jgi:NDP-sugar pyrophosphorylase family protein
MRAMILAAGLGTRLRPLTDTRPKALVEIGGRTLLEIALSRLYRFGVRDVIINTHHFADMVATYVKSHDFGMRIEISREEELLDTGGGLKKAAHFFLEQGSDEPFLVHNVDVVSAIDLQRMIQWHGEHRALATLAVQDRNALRQLLFDEQFQLCGRKTDDSPPELVHRCASPQPFAFCGIHVISPGIFSRMREEGVFSIITSYLRLAQQGERIIAFRADDYYWRDVGKPRSVEEAVNDLQRFQL